jgi:hypothetical protein
VDYGHGSGPSRCRSTSPSTVGGSLPRSLLAQQWTAIERPVLSKRKPRPTPTLAPALGSAVRASHIQNRQFTAPCHATSASRAVIGAVREDAASLSFCTAFALCLAVAWHATTTRAGHEKHLNAQQLTSPALFPGHHSATRRAGPASLEL